jgi:hypothetical protein
VSIDQNFGTGGSPSALVAGNGQAVTLSSTWTRYSLTFAIPSASGKTLGTNDDSSTQLNFWCSAGSNYATRSGNVGVQSNGIAFWGMQLEIGSVATPLEKLDPQQDLTKCQRFFFVGQLIHIGYGVTGAGASTTYSLPVSMRGVPTVAATANGNSNVAVPTLATLMNEAVWANTSVTATGTWTINQSFTVSADF